MRVPGHPESSGKHSSPHWPGKRSALLCPHTLNMLSALPTVPTSQKEAVSARVRENPVHWPNPKCTHKSFPHGLRGRQARVRRAGLQSQGYPLKSARKPSSAPGADYLPRPTERPKLRSPAPQEKWGTAVHTVTAALGAETGRS